MYALNNPVYFIDPDGMEATDSKVDMTDPNANLRVNVKPEGKVDIGYGRMVSRSSLSIAVNGSYWKPGKNGSLVAEKGDNTKTLAAYLGRNTSDVGEKFKKGGKSIGENYEFKTGEIVNLKNNMTSSIERSNGVTSDTGSTKGWDNKNDCYNCDQASQMAVAGIAITPANATNYGQFNANTPGFTEVKSFENTNFGEGIAIIGSGLNQHIVVNYGRSNDGTQYVYSKDGMFFKPQVKPLNEVAKSYGFTLSDVKYFQQTPSKQ